MKFGKVTIAALCAALVLTVCAVSCREDAADSVSNTDVSLSDMAYGVDDGTPLPRGVWAADSDERRTGYYLSAGDNTGYYLDAKYGQSTVFVLTDADSRKPKLHTGSDEEGNAYAELVIPDNNKRYLLWESDGRTVFLSLIIGANPDTFAFYSASDLLGAAYTCYENQHDGAHPEFFSTMVNVDGTVDIELYDKKGGKKQSAAFYQIDSMTGRGKELNSGEAVDFSKQ